MNERIYFADANARHCFFESVKKFGGYSSWLSIAKHNKIRIGNLWKYRFGKLCLPLTLFEKFMAKFPQKEREYYFNIIKRNDENWGQIKGGKITSMNHPEIIINARKSAKRRGQIKYDFDLNLKLNDEISEFIGAFIGDGFTGKYKTGKKFMYMTQFTGDSRYDSHYLKEIIFPIAKKYFNYTNENVRIKKNAIRLTFYSKRLFEFLTLRLGLPAGVKCYTVMIPDEIISDSVLVKRCIRGIFDTDGCVFFDKRSIYRKPYVRIALHMRNMPLLKQIQAEHEKLGINSKLTEAHESIQISGETNVKNFLQAVGFSNKRHLNKLSDFFF